MSNLSPGCSERPYPVYNKRVEKLGVVLATYNEAENLPRLIGSLEELFCARGLEAKIT